MDCRSPAACIFLVLILFAAFAGCTSVPAQQGMTTTPGTTPVTQEKTVTAAGETISKINPPSAQSIAEQLADVKSTSVVWHEAYRMFSNMRTTRYVHPPYTVDEPAGVYRFDCLGFVDHVLMNADPAGYKEIGKGVNPSIESYAGYFNRLDTVKPDASGWTRVAHPVDLKPGDVCLWLTPSTLDTGHMWIIAGEPSQNPNRSSEVLVRIFDSSKAHSYDSRTDSAYKTGLGSGILGMMVDGEGNPIGLYWDGGTSPAGEKGTTIVCGRLDR
ncbi:MAG: hypothetical protein Q7T80_10260 [Methanoregula sp.]|nr:hypothetical protein [Methanoregula sp.]